MDRPGQVSTRRRPWAFASRKGGHSGWGVTGQPRHTVEVGVEARQSSQAVILHEDNDECVVGQQAVRNAQVRCTRDLRAEDG